jgi:hypothetical protein
MQTLWDRAETDGYAAHVTDHPLPGTPAHMVLLEEAFGDHQVANVQTATEARTIGAAVRRPALGSSRGAYRDGLWGIRSLPHGTTRRSALFVWDAGVPDPPLTDTPPTAGADPHDTTPRAVPAEWKQMATFFRTGEVTDPCGRAPCTAPSPR